MDVDDIGECILYIDAFKYRDTNYTFTEIIALINDNNDCRIYRTGSCQECKHNKLCTVYEDVINWM